MRVSTCFVFALTLFATAAKADVAYDSLGSPAEYRSNFGFTLGTPNANVFNPFRIGLVFSSATTGVITQIDAALSFSRGTAATAALWTVASGNTPGDLLGSWDFEMTQRVGPCCALTSIPTPGGPKLTAGTQYFLTMSVDDDVFAIWHRALVAGSMYATDNNGATWDPITFTNEAGAVRILTRVPEPQELTMALPLLGLFLVWKRRFTMAG
ncbi:hypothetical protein F183_A11280 [Bryobacterales bacterium F-183]|nr:hypothetical protein F183_A11280 [Bryobacterales bacterium F-183]